MGLDAIEGWETCEDCGYMHWHGMWKIDNDNDKWVCGDCFSERYTRCKFCNHTTSKARMHKLSSTSGRLCDQCLLDGTRGNYIARIVNGTDMTIAHVLEMMEQRKLELKNLVTDEGALFIMGHELGIPMRDDDDDVIIQEITPIIENIANITIEEVNRARPSHIHDDDEIIRRLQK